MTPPRPHSLSARKFALGLLLPLAFLMAPGFAAPKAKLSVSAAGWDAQNRTLTVTGSLTNSSDTVQIRHINGRLLGSPSGAAFNFASTQDQVSTAPCAVRVQAGNLDVIKPVAGAPSSCTRTPICKIVSPKNGDHFTINQNIKFKASASVKDPKGKPLKLEWDFAGGSMGEAIKGANPPAYRRPTSTHTMVQFVRNNSRYRVRFSAMSGSVQALEGAEARCEDSVEIVVGDAPDTGLGKVPEQGAAQTGEQLAGTPGSLVVLPYEDLTFQNASDMRLNPNGYVSFSPAVNRLRAVVYSKDLRPPVIGAAGDQTVAVRYSAASSPQDPIGANSINSTSQNWPVDATNKRGEPFVTALIKKSDMWETYDRPGEEQNQGYASTHWLQAAYYDYAWDRAPFYDDAKTQPNPKPDEGMFAPNDYTSFMDANVALNSEHGLRMPGIAEPYKANDPQAFSRYNDKTKLFEANMLPLTGIDDQGRVNPFPLLRIEAVDPSAPESTAAKVDVVATAGDDFHCRECHAKGKIAAKSNEQRAKERLIPFTQDAFHSSAFPKWWDTENPPADVLTEPPFKSVTDLGGNPDTIQDQEYAAAFNYSSIHDFYDEMYFSKTMLHGFRWDETTAGVDADSPHPCYGCHLTQQSTVPINRVGADMPSWGIDSQSYSPNYSVAMHRFHGQLQWNKKKNDIERDARGVYKRWDWNQGPNNKLGQSLFPIFDAKGKQLPMEQNCLRCHAGHREQFYRDRMYTSGVTCYDCHGDMLAVGQAYPKNFLDNKAKANSTQLDDYRQPWFDEPDCGSCHTGTANSGADGKSGYYSAGVKKRAFDDNDWSATPRPVDQKDPDAARFAVVPAYKLSFPVNYMLFGDAPSDPFPEFQLDYKVDAPLFREGRDAHGNVPCAACHGAAHAVWPNRDPNANDNVTALQLQGHTGTILECNVCHTTESFKAESDLNAGQYMQASLGIQDSNYILGGPHNTHPIFDPYWWKSAPNDRANKDGSTSGGWHNNYAQRSLDVGLASNYDQCVACHGNDRKGTRLSRTPVERVFDFTSVSNEEFSKLQAAGLKARTITVPAGTPIGCDTCHSIATSCLKQDGTDPACGVATGFVNSSPNRPPTFNGSTTSYAAYAGTTFSYDASLYFTDPDYDTLRFDLGTQIPAIKNGETTTPVMEISESGLVTANWPDQFFADAQFSLPVKLALVITASDGRGGMARQTLDINVQCPESAPNWDSGLRKCASNRITSTPSSTVISSGVLFSYPVTTSRPADHFQLADVSPKDPRPTAMTIDAATGLIEWTPDENTPATIRFRVVALDAQDVPQASQDVTLNACSSGTVWHSSTGECHANTPPTVTQPANLGTSAGKTFSYQVVAADAEHDVLSYSLAEKPDNMTINPATGAITWGPAVRPAASPYTVPFTVTVDDGLPGGSKTISASVMVCSAKQSWMKMGNSWMCM